LRVPERGSVHAPVREEEEEREEEDRLRKASSWLVGLRWVAVVGIAVALGVCGWGFPEQMAGAMEPLAVSLAVLAIANVWFAIASPRYPNPSAVLEVQGVADVILLTVLLHFSGGVGNPFFLCYGFHVILAAILLSRRWAYLLGGLSVVSFSGMGVLEFLGFLEHHPFPGAETPWLGSGIYLAGLMAALAVSLFGSAYFTGAVVGQLREREREQRALLWLTRRQERLTLLGEVAAGLAHEIGNPLDGAMNFLSLLDGKLQPAGKVKEYLELIGEAHRRIRKITERLLVLSRERKGQEASTDVNELVDHALAFLEHRYKQEGVVLEKRFSDGLPRISVDPDSLSEVVINLVSNALDAVSFNGRVRITTGRGSRNGDGVEIVVEDDGCGIPPGHLEKIYSPFFTTKPIGKGSGLGLAISRRIVEEHRGTLSVESRVGAGSRFSVFLPLRREHGNGGAYARV
jgi:signal transduction histidine kinase